MRKTQKFFAGILLMLSLVCFLPAMKARAVDIRESQDGIWRYEMYTADTIKLVGIYNDEYEKAYGTIRNVTFPSMVDGYRVVKIHLLHGCLSGDVHSITVPEGITELSSFDFGYNNYSNVETINLPASLTKIGNQAFSGWSSLSQVNFAQGSQLSVIDDLAFNQTTSLTSFPFESLTNLKTIGGSAFKDSFLTSVKIGNKVKIGSSAFESCPALTSFTVGNDCDLEGYTCGECHSLKTASIGNGCFLDIKIFYECENLSKLTLGNVKKIERDLFTTQKIKSLTIPKSCTSLPAYYEIVPKSVTLNVYKGSQGEAYAKKMGYKYKYVSGTSAKKPDKVTKLKVKKSGTTAKLSWKKVNNANGYEVYMKTGSKGFKKITAIKKGSTVKYDKKKLKKKTTYTFKVRAYQTTKSSKVYGPYSSTVKVKF
ncbi:leucine-rich repeat domain-containing protein [Lachnospiraceae bacterium 38-14]